MLCYRCGSHVSDGSPNCPNCGQSFASGGLRQATGTFSRRKLATAQIDGAPYKPGDVIAGRYTIKDIVGQGPVGFVFRAHDKEMDVEVALKSVSPRLLQTTDERRAFAREFKGARKLNHNNIARIYEEGEHDDRPYYTSQFLDGLSLRKIIDLRKEKGQFFRLDEIEPILAQIAGALDDAHHAGVVHGDLKPENVLVLPDLLKVTDFALGMAMPRLPFVNAQKTRKADRYCAPEFASGGEVSSAIDVYALGAILGEMLAGLLPEGGDIPELSHVNDAITPALESIYRRAINGNPASRFARAGALAADIALLAGVPSEDVGLSTVPMSRKAVADALAASQAQSKPPALPARPPTDPARRTAVTRRPPPPPVALPRSDEVEITPVRPPVPVTDALELPVLMPPVLDRQEALPTQQLSLPDSRGDGEKTQVIAAPLAAPMPVARPLAAMPIARPLPPRPRSSLAFPVLAVVGLLAGVGGTWLYLQHQRAQLQEKLLSQQRIEAQQRADAEDAGRWQALDAAQAVVDAGPDMQLAKLPSDAGAPSTPNPSPGTELALAHTTGGGAPNPTADGDHCLEGMAYIAAGSYMKGYRAGDQLAGWDEVAFSRTHTDGYCIDLYEYPNQAGQTPTTDVTYSDAESSCASHGKRLCSEDEWERACKGPTNARFAWGDRFDKGACNLGKSTDPSGNHADCKSGYGVFDLSGNVAEWTSSRYSAAAGGKAVKGAPGEALARCAGRKPRSEGSKEPSLGFRCCKSAN